MSPDSFHRQPSLSSQISPPTSACSVRFHLSFMTTQKQIKLRWIPKTRSSLVLHKKCGCLVICEEILEKVVVRIFPNLQLALIINEWLTENWKLQHLEEVRNKCVSVLKMYYVWQCIIWSFFDVQTSCGGLKVSEFNQESILRFKISSDKVLDLKTNLYIFNFFTLILEGRGVTQSRVAQLALTDLSLMPTHFSHTCDNHI